MSASQADRARLAGLQPETLADMSVTQTLTMKASKRLERSGFLVGVTAELRAAAHNNTLHQ